MSSKNASGSLFGSQKPRRPKYLAEVRINSVLIGCLASPDEITPVMTGHGITARDIEPVLRGRLRARRFRCRGEVSITAKLNPPAKLGRLAA
jgi:hypothetical protein